MNEPILENVRVMENPSRDVVTKDMAAMDIAISRAAQEVQAAMIIAKKFPRDEDQAIARILSSCSRIGLADVAMYKYPRGDTNIEGPSIRLAEVLARDWGNIESGVIELDRRLGESTVMAYCWDLQTNFRDTKIFTVRHMRDTKYGPKPVRDERDIYEIIANMGIRRKRACMLAVIPGDVVELAQERINKTLAEKPSKPKTKDIQKMTEAFDDLGINTEMIEKRLGHHLDTINNQELNSLRKIYQSIRDGMGKCNDYFDVSDTQEPNRSRTQDVLEKIKGTVEEPQSPMEAPKQPVTEEKVGEIPREPSRLERLIVSFSEIKGITISESRQLLEKTCRALKKKALDNLTEEELIEMEKTIKIL